MDEEVEVKEKEKAVNLVVEEGSLANYTGTCEIPDMLPIMMARES